MIEVTVYSEMNFPHELKTGLGKCVKKTKTPL